MKTAAIIPARNEGDTIYNLVFDLRKRVDLVIVVDDASTDETGVIAVQAGAEVVYHEECKNIGPSIVDGLRVAMSHGDIRRFVTIDAGGSHDPADLPALLATDAEIVIGSRFVRGASYFGNPRRKYSSQIAGMMMRFCKPNGPQVTDWTSGFRVYSRKAVGALIYQRYDNIGHAWQIEVLMKSERMGFPVKEAPIHYRAGRSSLSAKSVLDAFGLWLEYFWR